MRLICKCLCTVLFFVIGCTPAVEDEEISIGSLLTEMVDRDKITQFPDPYYQSLQASSYNRTSVSKDAPGWFADSDGEYFIRTEEINGKKEWVLMEDEGPGVITKIWAVCFYYGLDNTLGANINIYLDGNTTPVISTNFFDLVKGEDFVKAPFADYSTRAGNLYLPIPYAKSCKITMDQKAFYNIINYRKYAEGTKVKTFTKEDFEQAKPIRKKVAEALSTYKELNGLRDKKEAILKTGTALDFNLPKGNNAIKEVRIKFLDTTNIAQKLRSTIIEASFDGEKTVWAPIGDFFNNVGKIQSYKMWERTVEEDGTMICRWVMPYENKGKIGIKNLGSEDVAIEMALITDQQAWTSNSMHFYATWQMDEPTPTFPLFDFNFLSASGKGVIVGDEWTVLNPIEGWWGEGDEKIYIDDDIDKKFPSHFGTGTEDYYGWAGGKVPTPADEFSKPFLGNIIVGEKSKGYNVCTRTRVLDAIPFKERIQFDVESSCGRRSKSHFLQYSQTTFWYAVPGAKHNKPPLPEYASLKLPTVADIEKVISKAKESQYSVDGALEAELLPIIKKGKGVVSDFAKIPMWGEISAGELNNIWFEHTGDFVELKITEQFEKASIKLCSAIGPSSGIFDIYINDIKIKEQDFYSKHEGIINPYLDLGESNPVNNAFVIRFVFKGTNAKARHTQNKYALGLDFFLIENNFLNRE
ncbi:glycoside hydrolase family 172 protein [Maribacter ulvicola]|uniref:DUF2961 domain-containing protein n=1 Tax=Maribacter ulvicola TaxID=228959 RepID=A0A1N6Y947_9FLAO|nr:glycoside hydrolase family 172 protein [Maribacter ulvicola]SIR11090.1 Protein of unknown function [Maribacter ulvicola]